MPTSNESTLGILSFPKQRMGTSELKRTSEQRVNGGTRPDEVLAHLRLQPFALSIILRLSASRLFGSLRQAIVTRGSDYETPLNSEVPDN